MNNQKHEYQQHFITQKSGSLFLFILSLATVSLLFSAKLDRSLAYTFEAPPTVIAVSPPEAYNWRETAITITGTNFVTSTIVMLGNIHLTPVNFISSNTLISTVPANLPAGVYTLTVTNPDSQSASLTSAFTVLISGDGSMGTWQVANPMTTEREWLASVVSGGYIYALGGYDCSSNYLDTVERAMRNADGTLGAWQALNSMTTRRGFLAAVVSGGYIYALGGYDGNGHYLDTVERAMINADGTLGAWQALNSMTTMRSWLAAVVSGGYIYALGGNNDSGDLDTVERAMINADGTLGEWQALNSMTTKRNALAAVVSGSYVYAAGGYRGSGPLNTIERVMINADGTLGSWQEVNPMTEKRGALAAVVSGGYIYALGGQVGFGYLDTIERAMINADGTLGSWQEVNKMTTKRHNLAAVVSGGYIYALGGNDGSGCLGTVEWTETNPPRLNAFFPSAVPSDRPTIVTVNGVNILPTPILRLGNTNLTTSFVSTTILTTTIPSGLANGWYSATVTSGDGRVATLANAVRVDGPGPVAVGDYGLTINDGALFTNKITVTLTIGSRNDTALMQVSNDGGFAGVQWETYTSHKKWQITQYGNYVIPRVVYVRYKDIKGNVSATFQDDIILDVTPPEGGFQIITGTLNTLKASSSYSEVMLISRTPTQAHLIYLPLVARNYPAYIQVILSLWATDDVSGVGEMMISNYPYFTGAHWEPYTTRKDWLVPDTGMTTIYVKFRDNAGNVSVIYSHTFSP